MTETADINQYTRSRVIDPPPRVHSVGYASRIIVFGI